MPQGAPHPEPVLHRAQVPGGRIRHAGRGGVWLNCPISGDWAGSGQTAIWAEGTRRAVRQGRGGARITIQSEPGHRRAVQ
ncbi:hypothetical protein E2I00_016878 [Balaenoptera physalus]|uniref:Uncharacterized protein n=1 Tax=Balaenoptera physalus TaxID=9770 RepID=A0A643BT72_BALPH|nr:hypothetical protein E2I00_016878 [Balaenoptera physalus]